MFWWVLGMACSTGTVELSSDELVFSLPLESGGTTHADEKEITASNSTWNPVYLLPSCHEEDDDIITVTSPWCSYGEELETDDSVDFSYDVFAEDWSGEQGTVQSA
jgi:hypothetical protein